MGIPQHLLPRVLQGHVRPVEVSGRLITGAVGGWAFNTMLSCDLDVYVWTHTLLTRPITRRILTLTCNLLCTMV